MSGLTPFTLRDDISLCTLPDGTVHLGRLLDMGWDVETVQQHGTPAARRAAEAYAATAHRCRQVSNFALVASLLLASAITGYTLLDTLLHLGAL